MKKKKDKATLKQGLFIIGVLVVFIFLGLILQGLYNFFTEPKFVITRNGVEVDEGELYCFWQEIEDCDYEGKLGLNVGWLDLHCEIIDSGCRYIQKDPPYNPSKKYFSETAEMQECLKIEDCFDLVCESPVKYQCWDYLVEVRKPLGFL